MSVLNQIASSLGRRDEVPNQELARDLAARHDKKGFREIADYADEFVTLPAINSTNKVDFITVLEKCIEDLSASELSRVKKVIKKATDL